MNKRLLQFINAENISQSQFADNIGVARASVSHIIAGRNKPGFDFVEKMARAFPALNIEWLITGHGKMYKTASGEATKPIVNESHSASDDLFGASWDDAFRAPEPAVESPAPVDDLPEENDVQVDETIGSDTLVKAIKATARQRSITKIIVFYDDNSFQEFH